MSFIRDFCDFADVTDLIFNNHTLDQHPVAWKKTDSGYKAICRTVGIAPDDVKIEMQERGISLKGETVVDDETYNVSYFMPISSSILNKIEEVKYESRDGLTYIYLQMKVGESKAIPISRM